MTCHSKGDDVPYCNWVLKYAQKCNILDVKDTGFLSKIVWVSTGGGQVWRTSNPAINVDSVALIPWACNGLTCAGFL